LVVAPFRVDLRIAALLFVVPERPLAADFLVALRPVADAVFLLPAERFAFARLLPAALLVAFFLVDRFFGF
jgi:hypothetical protein